MIKILNIKDIRCLDCYAFSTDITVTCAGNYLTSLPWLSIVQSIFDSLSLIVFSKFSSFLYVVKKMFMLIVWISTL